MDPEFLLDLHARAHRNLQGLLDHCREFDADALNRPLDGFGEANLRSQLHHLLTAERYWIGVLQGRIDAENDIDAHPDLESLVARREQVFAATQSYLRGASAETLRTAAEFDTWGGKRHALVPAHVFLRTVTHAYHHLGQIAAMCRLLGRPIPGFNYPIT